MSIGITGITLGYLAFIVRLPQVIISFIRLCQTQLGVPAAQQVPLKYTLYARQIAKTHQVFGLLFVAAYIFMPITSNWIWPRFGTPKEIVLLIIVSCICLFGGLTSIRIYSWRNSRKILETIINDRLLQIEKSRELKETEGEHDGAKAPLPLVTQEQKLI